MTKKLDCIGVTVTLPTRAAWLVRIEDILQLMSQHAVEVTQSSAPSRRVTIESSVCIVDSHQVDHIGVTAMLPTRVIWIVRIEEVAATAEPSQQVSCGRISQPLLARSIKSIRLFGALRIYFRAHFIAGRWFTVSLCVTIGFD